jgi:UDP-N-acetylglucosamine--N-acetylmuramyl-(pentapeptide) pyrophosphoryl-undecaprenol N-acetylglucosamine transferase
MSPNESRTRLVLACSPGGHHDLLLRLRDAWSRYERTWVTQPSPIADQILADGERVHFLPHYDRNPLRGRWLSRTLRSVALAIRLRPDVIVTTGAGLVVPFCVFAWLLGARIVMIETSARVLTPSQAGRLLGRLATRCLVQWDALERCYPRVTVCRPSVVDQVRPDDRLGDRTGIFVGVGTMDAGFDRLLRAVDQALEAGTLTGPVRVQSGVSSYRPRNFDLHPWLERHEVESGVAASRFVVCHAGIGLISTALANGIRPMVLPRLSRFGEHYDDHQEQIADQLDRLNLGVRLTDSINPDHVARAALPLRQVVDARPRLHEVLARELEHLLGGLTLVA